MSPGEREQFLVGVLDSLSDPKAAMAEGRRHKKAKDRAIDMLGLHFGSIGRVIYLAEELAVLYPGEPAFVPDILAVLDVLQPEDDPRLAWVVAEEGRGLDLVIEVLHHGDRKKDLEDNVVRYARLGIGEYFVYDRLRQRVVGHRLPPSGELRYQPILPQFGRYASTVLGLDLAVEQGELRFFYGMAELFGSAELIGRLKGMVEDLEVRADQAQAKADQAQAKFDQAQAKADQALVGLRDALLGLLEARGLPCPPEARSRVGAEDDPETLSRWLLRAASAATATEVFD